MAQALDAAMPPNLDLPDGYRVVWAAVDPTDGSDVSGVVVTGVSMFGTALGVGGGSFDVPNPILIGMSV